jgi:hypothetical protein
MSVVTDRQIRESDKLIAALERYQATLPFAQEHLALHQPLNAELRARREADDRLRAEWKMANEARDALADQYLKLYLDAEAELVDHLGQDSPLLSEFVWTGPGALDRPFEVLSVLEKMQAAFANHADLPFGAGYSAPLSAAIEALGEAIQEAERLENAVRESARQRQEVEAGYRQARARTKRRLVRHFKAGPYPPQLDEFLGP